jgi:hypothetical protein
LVLALVRPPLQRGTLVLSAFVVLLLPAAAHAAAPANDAFGSAISLAPGTTVRGNDLNATAEGAEPSPTPDAVSPGCSHVTDGPNCATSVWYAFHAPASTNYTIETCDYGTDFTPVLSAWTGSGLGSLSLVTSSDFAGSCPSAGFGNEGARISFDVSAGATYWVDVEGYEAAQGAFYLRAYATSSPPAAAEPDTLINREHSLAFARLELDGGSSVGNDVQSGPRQTASFDFSSDEAGATFECSLDGSAFAACTSPVSYDGLDSGEHTFKVRAVAGSVPDPTPAVQMFNLDDTPPDTGITGPTGLDRVTSATWDLTSTDPAFEQNYKCTFDGSVPFACDPQADFTNLCAGDHELQAAAFDLADNLDTTPAVADLNTNASAGDDCGAPGLVGSPSATPDSTNVGLSTSFDTTGSGGTLRVDWGTTDSYGSSVSQAVLPDASSGNVSLFYLTPDTEYHYRFVLTTPSGTTVGGDHTFTTDAAGSAVPDVSEGAPVAVGSHAVVVPINIDPHGSRISQYGVAIDDAPVTLSSPFLAGLDDPTETAPFQRTLDVVDLAPNTTYHVKAFAFELGNGAESSERTFTTPPISVPPPQPPPVSPPQPQPPVTPTPPPIAARFRLRAAEVHIGRLRRAAKTVTLTVKGLPQGAAVTAQLRAGAGSSAVKTLAKAHAKANAKGVAKLTLKLSRKARKALRSRRVKSVTIRVAATVAHGAPTVVTLHKRLR